MTINRLLLFLVGIHFFHLAFSQKQERIVLYPCKKPFEQVISMNAQSSSFKMELQELSETLQKISKGDIDKVWRFSKGGAYSFQACLRRSSDLQKDSSALAKENQPFISMNLLKVWDVDSNSNTHEEREKETDFST